MGLSQITIWTTHLNNRISVSANEIVCNWILKRSIIPTGILIGSYQGFLIAEIDFFRLNPGTSTVQWVNESESNTFYFVLISLKLF